MNISDFQASGIGNTLLSVYKKHDMYITVHNKVI